VKRNLGIRPPVMNLMISVSEIIILNYRSLIHVHTINWILLTA